MSLLHPTTDEEPVLRGYALLLGTPLFATLSTLGIMLAASYLRRVGWHIPDYGDAISLLNAGVAMIGAGLGGFGSHPAIRKRCERGLVFAFFGLYFYAIFSAAAHFTIILLRDYLFWLQLFTDT